MKLLEGTVAGDSDHFRITFVSDPQRVDCEQVLVALVGRGRTRDEAVVDYVIDRSHARAEEALTSAANEIRFYLVDKDERDPWLYAKYHCGTASNAYSQVRWAFHRRTP